MTDAKNPWLREHSRTVDQRDCSMPPTWVADEDSAPVAKRQASEFVWTSGSDRQMANRAVDLLRHAQKKAVVCSFLIADRQVEDAMLEAAGRGVRVYVMLASEARLEREPGDDEFERSVYEGHKAMLQRLGGRVLFRSAPNFHAKCILADPEDAPAGMLLTANLTSEALERNNELAVELSEDEVRRAADLMRWAMWEAADHEMQDDRSFRAVKPLGCVAHPGNGGGVLATTPQEHALAGDHESGPYEPCTQLLDEALDVIGSASKELIVASFGWDAGLVVTQYLVERAREGLNVTVLARLRPKSMPALVALAEAGAQIQGFRWLHAKALWSDAGRGLVMSANLEPHGLDDGFELGVPLEGKRVEELRTCLAHWVSQARWELLPQPTLGELSGDVRVWQDKTFTELAIEDRREVDLGVVEAQSADGLGVERALPAVDGMGEPAHEVEYRWQVQAPELSHKAIQVYKQGTKGREARYDLPVYKEPDGRRVVAVRSPNQLHDARGVAEEAGAGAIVVANGAKV